jgi:hypothetical protein
MLELGRKGTTDSMIQVQQSQLFVRSFRRQGILHQQLNCSTSLAAVVYAADTEVGLKVEITSDHSLEFATR